MNQQAIKDFYKTKHKVKKYDDEKYRKRFARKIEGGMSWLNRMDNNIKHKKG